MASVRALVTANMVIRTALMVCMSISAISCTIEPRSGVLACKLDVDCPENLVCRQVVDHDVKRCVGPRTAPWQPAASPDAAVGSGTDASNSDAGKDAAQTAPDAGTAVDAGQTAGPVVEDAGTRDPVDSGIQVSGRVTVLQTVNARSASIQITEATIEIQPMLCGPQNAAADKRICVIGGIRP